MLGAAYSPHSTPAKLEHWKGGQQRQVYGSAMLRIEHIGAHSCGQSFRKYMNTYNQVFADLEKAVIELCEDAFDASSGMMPQLMTEFGSAVPKLYGKRKAVTSAGLVPNTVWEVQSDLKELVFPTWNFSHIAAHVTMAQRLKNFCTT